MEINIKGISKAKVLSEEEAQKFFDSDQTYFDYLRRTAVTEKMESILDWTIVIVGVLALAFATVFLGPTG